MSDRSPGPGRVPSARRTPSIGAAAATLLFGALPATVLAAPALLYMLEAIPSLRDGEFDSLPAVAWTAGGVVGAAGLWAAVFRRRHRRVALLVLCGLIADGALIGAGLARDPGWFLPQSLGKDAIEVLLVVAPWVVGVVYVAQTVWPGDVLTPHPGRGAP